MTALRWILLVVGALFVGLLAWRELRRDRQSSRGSALPMAMSPPGPAAIEDSCPAVESPAASESATDSTSARMDADRPLPVIDWSNISAGRDDPALEPAITAPQAETPVAEAPAAAALVAIRVERPATALPSIDHWPPESERRICSVRLVPINQDRLAGRALRQSLQSSGFRHGALGIYHLAGADGQAVVSAANLARPGQLDPAMIDYQRFSGVHLFTVVSSVRPNEPALQKLFAVADELAGRLGATLQDDHGAPLDLDGMAALQQRYSAQSPRVAAGG
jgi:FtsZ-interacting cell division protein ZipA